MRFSIIIPTRNRADSLDRCLIAIGQLDYPRGDFEVLVADDGSTPVDGVVANHAALYVRCEGLGPARARNEALRRARADYVVFTDDDCMPDPNWLTALDRAYTESPNACLGGKVVDHPDNGICGVASQLLVSYLYEHGENQLTENHAQGMRFFCSNNFAFPREALIAMNGFDVNFPLAAAEDRDLCARWAARGELRLVAGAVVFHRQDLGPISFCRQHYRYGRGAYMFWRRRLAEGHGGNRIESRSFYARMLTYPFRFMPSAKAVAVSVLLAVSQVACAIGYYSQRRIEGSRSGAIRRRSP